jgi:phage shock protein E
MNTNFFLITGLLSFGYSLYAGAKYYSLTGLGLISSETAKDMINKNIFKFIIDVRTNFEYNLGNYKNSINIPVVDINQENLNKYSINKNDTILVYCNTGQRARYAVEKLRDLGYNKTFYIENIYKNLI